MRTKIVPIGNSQGIRIPRLLLIESRIGQEVELRVKRGEIRIVPVKRVTRRGSETALASERALARDWNRPEEDTAWNAL